jgi:N-acetylmuramoyl-L-alanine amidase
VSRIRRTRSVNLTLALLLIVLSFPLLPTTAATDLTPGLTAVIRGMDRELVALRSEPSVTSELLGEFPATTEVLIRSMAVPSPEDGELWYEVAIGELIGYMPAIDLDRSPPAFQAPEDPVGPEPAAEEPPVAEPTLETETPLAEPDESATATAESPLDPEQPSTEPAIPPTEEPVIPTNEPVVEEPVIDEPEAPPSSPEPIDEATPSEAPNITPSATAEEDGIVVAAAIVGSGVIANTGGAPVNCRTAPNTTSAIITIVTAGSQVNLTGPAQNDWQPVMCGGQNGYIFAQYVQVSSDPTTTASSSTGTGTVTGTNGDGVRCRSTASLTGPIIAVLPEGGIVSLRGARQGDWQPVTCAGQDGFVYATYLTIGGQPAGGGSTTQPTGVGVVQSTGGLGLRCRVSASFDGTTITVIPEGTEVSLRGTAQGVWQPVICAGRDGWVHSDYLRIGSGGGSPSPTPTAPSNSSLAPGASAVVSNTGGMGVRFRSEPSYSASVIAVLNEGQQVTVRQGSTGDWVAVTANGSNGFVHRDYLIAGTGSSGPGNTTGGLANGDHARVTESLRLRSGPSLSSDVLGVAPAGTVVKVTGSLNNSFYPVQWGSTNGYMHGDYLQKTTSPLSPGGGSVGGNAGSGSGTASGQAMVDYAMNYLGYPYVWATAGPSSFDCSGFTYWVVKNVLGRDIGRGLWTQWGSGRHIAYGELQPGDLVFFQNTYTTGLSHVGLYIGNNEFIHAENPTTGVRVSRLDWPYYADRWLGARRLV